MKTIEISDITYKLLKKLMKGLKYKNKDIDKCLQGAICMNFIVIGKIQENRKK